MTAPPGETRRLTPLALAMGAALVALPAAWPSLVQAQEHPEHPKKGAAGKEHPEHPEHPKEKAKAATFTTADMSRGIRQFVEKDADLHGGKFIVWDDVKKQPLVLELTKVHEERLSQIGNDTAFVCADFTAADGTVYDLDFFMRGPDGEHLTVTDIAIHKEVGKPRYGWQEKDGLWVRVPAPKS